MRHLKTIGVAVAALLAFGCLHKSAPESIDAATDDRLAVEAVYRDIDCPSPPSAPHAHWIDTPHDLQRCWAAQRQVPGKVQPPPIPEVDFHSQGLLLIHMGRQSTGGYALALADPAGRLAGDTLSVTVNWITPAAGRATVQMITAPCLLLKLPRGRYRSIQVTDTHGRLRVVASLPPPAP